MKPPVCEERRFGLNIPELLFFLRVLLITTDLPTTTLTLDLSSENLIMKMKKLLATLLALGLSIQQAPAQTGSHFSNASATRTLSDAGDTSSYVSTPAGRAVDMSVLAPTSYSYGGGVEPSAYTQSSYDGDMSGYGGYVSEEETTPSGWFSTENLLTFAAKRTSPVLVTTSGANVLPLQGAPGVTDAFGGTISPDMILGYRLSAGKYFGPQEKVGLGIRGYGIFDSSEIFAQSSTGASSIGVPFLNLNAGSPNQQTAPGLTGAAQDAYIVAGNTPAALPIATGSVRAADQLKMIGTDISGYILIARSGSFRTDMVSGYTYNQLRNRTSLYTTSTNQFTGDLIANGTVLTTYDDFQVENRFNGAHLGVLSSVVRNRASFSTLAKIAFGSMRSRVIVNGSSTVAGVADTQGIFAMPDNIGASTSEHFAFLPELGMKLGYAVRPNIQLTVGYTLLVWSDVMLSGEQIDPTVNLSGLGPRPLPTNKHSAYWMQSVDLGLNFVY